jgi:hypothetical protein
LTIKDKIIKSKILQEIETRKEIYQTSSSDMISAYNREVETEKEYNGRQLLELLQNADDEKSDEVLIKLDTNKNILTISNRGTACSSFSHEGIRSLMISNLSSKTTKKFIGNKGLGFRSIINWSEKIIINSNGLDIKFSREIVNSVFDELFNSEIQDKIRAERNLPKSIKPIPFLSIPSIKDNKQEEWTTSVSIQYKSNFLGDIQKQISELKNEILLFLNSIQKLTVIVDDVVQLDIDKSTLSEKWTIFQKREVLPKDLWDKENEEEYFDLKIALQDNLENDIEELFSYFPTKIDINLPFIVHGTFELNSSRNEINDSLKNRYILEQLVELIVSTAKEITEEEVSYKALEMLSYSTQNNILDDLGFYKSIKNAIEELEVFPCLDRKYRTMNEAISIDPLSTFAQKTQNEYLFDNLLIPLNEDINLEHYFLESSIDTKKLNELSRNIKDISDRADLIYLFYHTFQDEEKLLFLIDKDEKLISIDDDVYTPSKYDFSIPEFVNIKFIHKDLFDKLILRFGINSNEKSRDLQRKLKEITNIQSYEPAPVLQKIVTSTNKELEKTGADKVNIVKEMVQSLYKNYILLDKTKIPADTKIQLLTKSKSLADAKKIFLSESYPSGKLTELLFNEIYAEEDFLADVSLYGFENEDLKDIEEFFIWLGVNRYTKFSSKSQDSSYINFVFKHIDKPINYRDCSLRLRIIDNFEEIIEKLALEKIILWLSLDEKIYSQLDYNNSDEFKYSKNREHHGNYSHTIHNKPSYILYQILATGLFNDYLIGNNKLSPLINSISFDFNNKWFEEYKINKSDIESILLKIGAVDKFEKLSIDAVSRIVENLPVNSLEGKQAQSVYKLCIKHFEQNKVPLNDKEDVMLFAKKGETKQYFPLNEVFYNGNIKLPKKITDSKVVLDYPRRQSTTNVISFFGINNLNSIKIDVLDKEVSQSLTNDFKALLDQIKEYILVYRIKDIETDKTADIELRKLQNINLLLCSDVEYKIDEESFSLDYNDYIKHNSDYLIKVDVTKNLRQIKSTFEFQESFADIIGLVFDIQETKVFRDMIKDDISYIEKTIRNDIGNDELIRARELLGKTDELFSFWKAIYSLINKEYTYTSDNKLYDLIKQDLALSTPIEKIDYRHLNTRNTCLYVKLLFNELKISIQEFNDSDTFYKVDFSEFHRLNIEQAFDENSKYFQRKIYTYCLNENKKKEFNNLKAMYNQNGAYSKEKADEHKYELNVDYKDIVKEYIDEFFEIKSYEPTKIDFKAIYDKNVLQIHLDKLDGRTEYISLLYFNDTLDTINEYIDSCSQEESEYSKQDDETESITKPIVDIGLGDAPASRPPKSGSTKPYKHNPKSDVKKQHRGKKAEQAVYKSLVVEYGKDNVEQVSNDDDSLGYDIKYKNKDGEFKYVEVKSFSAGQFYLTKNEKEFAQQHIGSYEVFLVGEEIYRLPDINYNDSSKFILIANEFIVKYAIEEDPT